uniref:Uncharacterized protein n=1 Tax=Anopheles stephensi TaxID=30069 RepID=A0A182Y9W5_ANOST
MQNTGALFFDFKPNDSITGVLVKNARLSIISITLGDLPSLEYIILEATDIQAMEVSLFCPFRCLKLVRVSHGKLNTISGTGTNVHQCSLESLKLHHNSLTAVNLNLFAPFTSLTLFDLSHNKIEVLSGRLTSPFLTSLLLNNNRLKVLNLCPWNVVRHLNVFSIAHNNITRMPPCLDRFPNVTHLSMQFNQIDTMEVEQLARLPNLTSINLSFNNIATIPVDEHLYPQNLKQIDLGGNLIKNDTVPSSHIAAELCSTVACFVDSLIINDSPNVHKVHVPSTCNISVVDLHYTGLQYLHFEQNDSITSVLVRKNRLRIVPATLALLPNVRYVMLDSTEFEAIDLNLFYPLRHLKILDVGNAKIKYVRGTSRTVSTCPLEILKLRHNSLTIVNLNLFAPFTLLTLLDLSHNKIEVLAGRLSNPILASLLLNNNRLKALDLCTWSTLRHLDAVSIAHNNVSRTPTCLNRFRNVTHISMQFNQIDSIEVAQLLQLPNLTSLNLSNNNITSFPVSEHQYPQALRQLDLYGNPISNPFNETMR